MKKLTRRVFASVVTGLALVASCSSPFDQGSSLGDQILRDSDPRITDPGATVKVTKLGIPIDSAFSAQVRALNGVDAGVHTGRTDLVLGRVQRLRSVAYIKFGDTLTTFTVPQKYTEFIRAELVLTPKDINQVQFVDSLVRVAQCAAREDSTLIDPMVADSILKSAARLSVAFDSAILKTGADTLYRANQLVLPITDTVILKVLEDALTSARDTTVSFGVSFLADIDPAKSNFVRFSTPLLRAWYGYKKSDTSSVTTEESVESYCTYAEISVLEDDSASLDLSATTSSASDRKAVLSLDLSPLWTSLTSAAAGDTFRSILEAFVDVKIGDVRVDGGDSLAIGYVLRNLPIGDSALSNVMTYGIAGRTQYFKNGAAPSLPIHLAFTQQLQRMISQGESPTAYLYLYTVSLDNGWGWIDFDVSAAKLEVQAALSNPQ